MSAEGYLVIGIVASLLFTELTMLSPGGIIVPGYIALAWQTPQRIVLTLLVALVAMALTRLLGRVVILYGRRRYGVFIVAAFAIRALAEVCLPLVAPAAPGIELIGWLVPGIIAADLDRQGIGYTVASLGAVSAVVRLAAEVFG